MGARLAATVLVQDPETHQTAELPKGSSPEPRLAALVTNPAAWEGGKVPAAVRKAAEAAHDDVGDGGGGQGNGDGDGPDTPPPGPEQSGDSGNASPTDDADTEAKPATKTPAKKTAASRPARRGDAAAEGTGGK